MVDSTIQGTARRATTCQLIGALRTAIGSIGAELFSNGSDSTDKTSDPLDRNIACHRTFSSRTNEQSVINKAKKCVAQANNWVLQANAAFQELLDSDVCV